MTQQDPSVMAHAAPDVEAGTLNSGKMKRWVTRYIAYRFANPVVLQPSLRVGRGTGLASMDGLDGTVMASGTQAGFFSGDSANPALATTFGLWLNGVFGILGHSGGVYTLVFRNDNGAVTTPKSLRAGSGTAIAGQDGSDGTIAADGPLAALWIKDRSAADFAGWYFVSGIFYLFHAGNIWAINATTGIITQDALSAMTPGANITIGYGGWPAPGSRLSKPTGQVYVMIALVTTAAIAALAPLAVITAAHRPTTFEPVSLRSSLGAARTGYFNSAGQLLCDQALINGEALLGTANYYLS